MMFLFPFHLMLLKLRKAIIFLTSADQNGLMAVFLSIQIQGASFVPTRFSFENGSELVITLSNYQAFMAVWLPFRQSFYLA